MSDDRSEAKLGTTQPPRSHALSEDSFYQDLRPWPKCVWSRNLIANDEVAAASLGQPLTA